MLTKPTKYQQGIDANSTMTGVILEIAGLELLGNVETNFTEGHVYNILTSWTGIRPTIDMFNNTYSKVVVSFTFSNVVYRQASGVRKRLSDDLRDKVGAQADIYFVNNENAKSLNDCLHPFAKGTVKTISDYDEKTITITLDSRSIVGQTKILKTQIKNLFDDNTSTEQDNLAATGFLPFGDETDDQMNLFVPIVYGDFSNEGVTGLMPGYRINSNTQPWFVFANHELKELNSLYIKTGDGFRAAENEGCQSIRYRSYVASSVSTYAGLYYFESIVFNMVTDAAIYYHLDGQGLTGNFRTRYYQPTAYKIGDNNVLSTADTVVTVTNSGNPDAQNPMTCYMGWEIHDAEEFKKQFEGSEPSPHCQVIFYNLYNKNEDSPHCWQLIYNDDMNVTYDIPMHTPLAINYPNTNTTPSKAVTTKPVYFTDLGSELNRVTRNYAVGYRTSIFNIGNGVQTATKIGEARLTLTYPWVAALEGGSKGLTTVYAAGMGRTYGWWASQFGVSNYINVLNETGAGIMASLLIDEIGEWYPFEDDFDIDSFNHCIINEIKMRICITDPDDTLDTIATKLGKQNLWTFCITPAGRAKMATLQKIWSTEAVVATLRYDEMKDSPKIGLTSEQYVINELTIKSRWFAERGEEFYDDVKTYINRDSQAKYGVRKAIIECKNINSAMVGG